MLVRVIRETEKERETDRQGENGQRESGWEQRQTDRNAERERDR